jgi:hypothetical protein
MFTHQDAADILNDLGVEVRVALIGLKDARAVYRETANRLDAAQARGYATYIIQDLQEILEIATRLVSRCRDDLAEAIQRQGGLP